MLKDTPTTEDRYSGVDVLQLDALQIEQGDGRYIFAFGMNGKHIRLFADISRARRRDGDTSLLGYQRPEVRKHISEIREYIDSAEAMIPNAIVVALGKGVTFQPRRQTEAPDGDSVPGRLYIPCPTGDDEKVGFVVDGQQRLAAIRQSRRDNFPMFVLAFMAETDEEQRKQFLLVNATKPLPRGLIHELLPGTRGHLPKRLQRRKLPAELVAHLNHTSGSPLEGTIRTSTVPSGRIADNSMLRMLEDSLSDGILWELAQVTDGDGDASVDQMYSVLSEFWWAVRTVWAGIWQLKPRQSRLLHGAGIISLGYLMEEMISRYPGTGLPDRSWFIKQLGLIKDECQWTTGTWDFSDGSRRRWDEVQNVNRDVVMLANHLTRLYRIRARRSRHSNTP